MSNTGSGIGVADIDLTTGALCAIEMISAAMKKLVEAGANPFAETTEIIIDSLDVEIKKISKIGRSQQGYQSYYVKGFFLDIEIAGEIFIKDSIKKSGAGDESQVSFSQARFKFSKEGTTQEYSFSFDPLSDKARVIFYREVGA